MTVMSAASGMAIDEYLATHVTGPLGMADTTFTLSDAQRPRLVAVHQRQPDGSLALVGDLQLLSRSRQLPVLLGRITRDYAARLALRQAGDMLPEAVLQVGA